MSDSSENLPTLPAAQEPDRPHPKDRYLTQLLTRAVPQVKRLAPQTRLGWGLLAGGVVLALVLAVSLGSDGAKVAAASDAKAATLESPGSDRWVDEQLIEWKADGLAPGGFAPVDASTLGASMCHGGAAAALEITLCRFASPAAAAGAIKRAERSIGKNTGIVLADRERLLVVADRRNADPSGRIINQLAKGFSP